MQPRRHDTLLRRYDTLLRRHDTLLRRHDTLLRRHDTIAMGDNRELVGAVSHVTPTRIDSRHMVRILDESCHVVHNGDHRSSIHDQGTIQHHSMSATGCMEIYGHNRLIV